MTLASVFGVSKRDLRQPPSPAATPVAWSFCLYECGYAIGKGVPVYVFQCTKEQAPAPLRHLVHISVGEKNDIQKFVNGFLTNPHFFVNQNDTITHFSLNDHAVQKKSKDLYDRLTASLSIASRSKRIMNIMNKRPVLAGAIGGATVILFASAVVIFGLIWLSPNASLVKTMLTAGFTEAIKMPFDITPHVSTFEGAINCLGDKLANTQYVETDIGADLDRKLSHRFGVDTGIQIIPYNRFERERASSLKSILEPNAGYTFDVVAIDTIMVKAYAGKLIDLGPFFNQQVNEYSDIDKRLIRNNTVDGRVVAMPLYQDVGVLYYRKDLLKRYGYVDKHGREMYPETWDDLERQAEKIQDEERKHSKNFTGFVWQRQDYEGLTCNALEWIGSHGGFDQERNRVLFNSRPDAVIEALNRARIWVKGEKGKRAPISDNVEYNEEGSLKRFMEGEAAFFAALAKCA